MALINDLHDRLTVWQRVERENDIGETDIDYTPVGDVWGALGVTGGRTEPLAGDMERITATHKITLRRDAVALTPDTYFICEGLRYDVLYWMPHYKKRDRVEVYCELVIER